MAITDVAFAVRAGEHACCRAVDRRDRERLAAGFVLAGLSRGYKVVYLCDPRDADPTLALLRAADARVEEALQRGQFDVRDAAATYAPDGTFDVERMLEAVRTEHTRALAAGYAGLSMTGDVGAGLSGIPGAQRLAEYERRLDAQLGGTTDVLLCQYDHPTFDPQTISDAAAAHHVDVSAQLAAIGRTGVLAAARVHPPEMLRLAGELDFECAEGVADVVGAEFRRPLQVDLADLSFIDVAGLRALRGGATGGLTICAASQPVRRLVELLAWDTDPAVRVSA
jgi:ABC-type transporter Mla MlaB component